MLQEKKKMQKIKKKFLKNLVSKKKGCNFALAKGKQPRAKTMVP